MATTDLATLGVEVRSEGVWFASVRLRDLTNAAKGAASEIERLQAAFSRINNIARRTSTSLSSVGRSLTDAVSGTGGFASATAGLVGTVERLRSAVREMSSELNRVRAGSGRASSGLSRMSRTISSSTMVSDLLNASVSRLAQALIGLHLATKAFGAAKDFTKWGIAFNQEMESARIGMASVLAATAQLQTSQGEVVGGAQKYAAAQGIARDMMTEIQALALETTATTRELVAGTQAVIAPAVRYGVALERIPQLATNIAQAMSAMNIPLVQMRTESEALLSGNINRAQDLLASNLAITGAMVRDWQKQGTLVEELTARLQSFKQAGEDVAHTVAGLKANFSEYLDVISGQATEGLTHSIKNLYNDLLNFLNQARGSGQKFEPSPEVQNIVNEMSAAYNALGIVVERVGKTIVQWLKDINEYIGNVDIVAETERISKAISVLAKAVEYAVVAFTSYKVAVWALSTSTGKLTVALVSGRASLYDSAVQAQRTAIANHELALSQQVAAQAAVNAAWANTANARTQAQAAAASAALTAAEQTLASANVRVAATANAVAASTSFMGVTMARAAGIAGATMTALSAALGRFMGFLGGPWGLALTLAGTAIYSLYSHFSDAAAESDNAMKHFEDFANSAERAAKVIPEQATLRVNRALEAAKIGLETARKNLEDSINRYQGETGDVWTDSIGFTDSFGGMKTFSERLFGASEATERAISAVKQFYAEMASAGDSLKDQYVALNKLYEAYTKLKDSLNPNAIKVMREEIGRTSAQLEEIAKKSNVFDEIAAKASEASGGVMQLSGAAKSLHDAFMLLEDSKIRMPSLEGDETSILAQLPQAIKFLTEFTSKTDDAKMEQFNMKKAAAQAYVTIVEMAAEAATATYMLQLQNYELAASYGPVSEAAYTALHNAAEQMNAIRAFATKMKDWVNKVEPPKLSSNRKNKTEEQLARYRQAATTKILELELKLEQTQQEIVGIQTSEIRVLELQQARVKELASLREKAARAGIKGEDAQLSRTIELTDKIYELKIAWEGTLGPLQHAADIAEALGDEGATAGAKMDILNARLAQVAQELEKVQQQKDALAGLGADVNTSSKEFEDLNNRIASSTKQMEQLVAQKFQLAWASRFSEGAAREEFEKNIGWMTALGVKMEYNNALASSRNDIYSETTGNLIGLNAQMQALTEAHKNQSISSDLFLSKMIQANAEYVKIKDSMGQDVSFGENMLSVFSRVTEGFTTMNEGLRQAWGDFCADFVDGFSNAVGRAIVYSEDLNTALQDLYKQIASQLISALVKLGVQWLITHTLGQTLSKSAEAVSIASSAATGAAIASAYAPAAAMVSLATFGANSGPAMAGITSVVTLSQLAAFTGFKSGGYTGDTSPNAIAGVVHGGEYVMDAKTVQRYGRGFFDELRLGGGNAPPTGVVPALPGGNQGGGGTFVVNVFNSASDTVQADTQTSMGADGTPQLDVLVTLVESRISEKMYRGNSQLGKAIDQTRGTNRDKSLYK